MAKKHVWYICPACRSRLAVEQDHAGEVRCRNCSKLLRAAKTGVAVTADRDDTTRQDLDDDYRLAPTDAERLAKESQPAAGHEPPVYHSELERLRARRERPADAPPTETPRASPREASVLPFGELEIRDDQRYKPEPPPRWTFFSGVFTYPWRPQSLLPWVVLSIGIAMFLAATHLVVAGLMSGVKEGVLIAGFFVLGLVWLLVLTGSYVAACLFAVTETTAYNFDAPYDWPEPDWRERFVHFLWVGWCLGLAVALAGVPSSFVTDGAQGRALGIVIGVGLLFPIFVLSTMETSSLSPFSGPVWSSLAGEAASWITFYVLTGALLAITGASSLFLYTRLGLLSAVVLGPLWAASILIYARLLGRLAWRIMRPGEVQLQSWRKAHQSTLAGEARKKSDGVIE